MDTFKDIVAPDSVLVPIVDMINISVSGQEYLSRVRRWSQYQEPGRPHKARPQNTLQHAYSISESGVYVLTIFGKAGLYFHFPLVVTAIIIHDKSEGDLYHSIGKDTLYKDKNVAGDVAEYEQMKIRYGSLPPAAFSFFEDAFLLQFAGSKRAEYPEYMRSKLDRIAKRYPTEVLLFEIIERWDYVMYGMEQYLVFGNRGCLTEALGRNIDHLDRLVRDLPIFGEKLLTPALRKWIEDFLSSDQADFSYRDEK